MKNISVELNLEETGWICNLLMRELSPFLLGKAINMSNDMMMILLRQQSLHDKIARANERLRHEDPPPVFMHIQGKIKCPVCNGKGKVIEQPYAATSTSLIDCTKCDGKGFL